MNYVKKEKKGNELTFELQGEDHTFANLLTAKLQEDKNIETAQYNIPHPLIGEPEFYIKVKKGDPKSALKKAVKALEKDISGLI